MARGENVVGLDHPNGSSNVKLNVGERSGMASLFADEKFDRVIHLAAQVGVRCSLPNPHAYVDSSIVGFVNILEGCRVSGVMHLVYASNSSVYGLNTKMPLNAVFQITTGFRAGCTCPAQ